MNSDPVHPNKTGYRKMALALAITLRDSGALIDSSCIDIAGYKY